MDERALDGGDELAGFLKHGDGVESVPAGWREKEDGVDRRVTGVATEDRAWEHAFRIRRRRVRLV
jgi:hypothetical protein